jgi:hypothetical protein
MDKAGGPAAEIMKLYSTSSMFMNYRMVRRITAITFFQCVYSLRAFDHMVVSSLTGRSLVRLGAAAAVELRP